MSTHPCPAPGCPHQVASELFACKRHWFAIPASVRARLWTEYDARFGEDSYWTARAEALAALGVPVDKIADENAGVPLGGPR